MTTATLDEDIRKLESRCVHDMIQWLPLGKSSCSICRGLPYVVPMSPLAEFEPALANDQAAPSLVWLPSDERGECAACEAPIRHGQLAAWSRLHEGPIGVCCRESVAA